VSIESDLRTHLASDPAKAHGIMALLTQTTTIRSRAKFRAYLAADMSNLSINSYTKVTFDTVAYNIGSNFSTAQNRFIAPEAGFYLFTTALHLAGVGAGHAHHLALYKNGSIVSSIYTATNAEADAISTHFTDILRLAAADYVEVYAKSVGNSTTDILSGATASFFTGHILSKDG